jgi:hypothetical protein
MNDLIITINQKTFKLRFGMKVFRLLSTAWDVPGLNGVMARFAILQTMADELTFDQLDIISDLIVAATQAHGENTETVTADEIDDLILYDSPAIMQVIEVVIQGFADSIPKQETPGKPMIAKKATAKMK